MCHEGRPTVMKDEQSFAGKNSGKNYGWVVVSKKTGKNLQHLKMDGKTIEFAGVQWHSVSAFAWADKKTHIIPHFSEKGARDMLKLYKEQTGDGDIEVKMVEF